MREIKFEYGFESTNGIVKKVYALSEIPNISHKCDVWNILPIIYVRQYTGLKDKNGVEIYEGDIVKGFKDGKEIKGITDFIIFKNAMFKFKSTFCNLIDFTHELSNKQLEVIGNIHKK